jgi:hypothetical protein
VLWRRALSLGRVLWASMCRTHSLLSRLCDVPLGLEKTPNIQGLSAPEVAVDAPVESKLEGPPVEASASRSVTGCSGRHGGVGAQNVYSGAHGDSFLSFRMGGGGAIGVVVPRCRVLMHKKCDVEARGSVLARNGAGPVDASDASAQVTSRCSPVIAAL